MKMYTWETVHKLFWPKHDEFFIFIFFSIPGLEDEGRGSVDRANSQKLTTNDAITYFKPYLFKVSILSLVKASLFFIWNFLIRNSLYLIFLSYRNCVLCLMLNFLFFTVNLHSHKTWLLLLVSSNLVFMPLNMKRSVFFRLSFFFLIMRCEDFTCETELKSFLLRHKLKYPRVAAGSLIYFIVNELSNNW